MPKATNRLPVRPPRAPASVLSWLGLQTPASVWILFLLALVLGSGLSVVYLTHRDRVLFNELQVLKEKANELDVQWGQWMIEQSTLGVGDRVEQQATEILNMQLPEVGKIILVK
ncbi:MAG: cell division protein FtsL [Gammaproteobacteria bacterium]|nr:cell division protein FtsL [Pseudomonadales bacterium]MCP5345557.1 cell division protein FtsL [Pseudomonadales bacterium]